MREMQRDDVGGGFSRLALWSLCFSWERLCYTQRDQRPVYFRCGQISESVGIQMQTILKVVQTVFSVSCQCKGLLCLFCPQMED